MYVDIVILNIFHLNKDFFFFFSFLFQVHGGTMQSSAWRCSECAVRRVFPPAQ